MSKTATLIVLFNLKKGIKHEDYQEFAKTIDSPTIKRQPSIKSFKILKATGLVGSNDAPPAEYIEVMEVSSFNELMIDINTEEVQSMLQKWSAFGEDLKLILTEQVN